MKLKDIPGVEHHLTEGLVFAFRVSDKSGYFPKTFKPEYECSVIRESDKAIAVACYAFNPVELRQGVHRRDLSIVLFRKGKRGTVLDSMCMDFTKGNVNYAERAVQGLSLKGMRVEFYEPAEKKEENESLQIAGK